MKKKLVFLSAGCVLASATIAISCVVASKGGLFSRSRGAVPDVYSVNILPDDLMAPVADNPSNFTSGNITVKTALGNDVDISFESAYTYVGPGDQHFIKMENNDFILYNTSSINCMNSLRLATDHDIDLLWGFDVDEFGIPIYEFELLDVYPGSGGYTFTFNDTQPNYFLIKSNPEGDHGAIYPSGISIKMGGNCAEGPNENPVVEANNYRFIDHNTYMEFIGFKKGLDSSARAIVNIPNKVNDIPVTVIASDAFEDETAITSLTLPNQLREIRAGAFEGCSGIAAINIPNTVTKIADSAFSGTSGCTSLTFEDGGTELMEVGVAAFKNNMHSGVLTLPSRIKSLSGSGYIFYGMDDVTAYALNDDNVANNDVSVVDGVLFGSSYGDKALISYPSAKSDVLSYTVPADIKVIQQYDGFLGAKYLKTINFINSVDLIIGSYGCAWMDSLETVNFNSTNGATIRIDGYAFEDSSKLTSLVIPNNIIVQNFGLSSISTTVGGLAIHFVEDEDPEKWVDGYYIPEGWGSYWCSSDLPNGYVTLDFGYVA